MSKYLLDSNIFIQSKNLHYRFSFCGNFWILLQDMHATGMVFTVKVVKQELLKPKTSYQIGFEAYLRRCF
ncbi:DUF4411 family protein [Ignatzschineria indica]|uniref:DUF4411 family protein n=1 Tax=Ignatzschineria indica TaxID=472583 RepID=UPI003633C009